MASYPNPMLDAMPSARKYAAKKGMEVVGRNCSGLHYAHTLGPWGYDMSTLGPTKGDFGLDSKGLVNRKRRDYTFAGIACYKPEFFHGLTIGRYSVTTKLFEWIDKQSVSGEIHSGTWFDIGSQKRLKAANG